MKAGRKPTESQAQKLLKIRNMNKTSKEPYIFTNGRLSELLQDFEKFLNIKKGNGIENRRYQNIPHIFVNDPMNFRDKR